MLDRQETFDTVLAHLRKQGMPSFRIGMAGLGANLCAYRGRDGAKCAIGALIPDKAYSPGMEGFSVDTDPVIDAIPGATLEEDGSFLSGLQGIHDISTARSAPFMVTVEELAETFAKEHNLEYDPPEED